MQGTYNFAYRANRLDEAYPVINYFIKNRENIEKFSESFFDLANSFFIPGTADLEGNIMGGWVQYTYSIPSSLWMITILDKWCDFCYDPDYKNNHLLPMMKGAFNLLDKVLIKENGGKYELCISATPEVNDSKYSAWVKNSTYDISIIKEFLKRYIKRLCESGECAKRAEQMLSGLVCEHIGESGYLLAEDMPLSVTHRHMSHCMNIFPFQTLDFRSDADMELMQKTLAHLEALGTKLWIGFSFVWMAALYATAANGEGALKYLDIFVDSFVSENGFHLNGDQKKKGHSNYTYHPFTIEGNCMFAEALQEMLMQYHHDTLYLFPAIPDAFKKEGCAFSGLRLDKDITVSASYKCGRIECSIFNSGNTREMEIYHGKSCKINLIHGENLIIINS